jgi:hypothetical protein
MIDKKTLGDLEEVRSFIGAALLWLNQTDMEMDDPVYTNMRNARVLQDRIISQVSEGLNENQS